MSSITDQASEALVAVLGEDVPSASTIDPGIRAEVNDKFNNRVVVVGSGASLRHPFVPGKYDVSGEVLVQQSVDSDDAETNFRTLCDEVRRSMENKDTYPGRLEAKQPGMLVYSWIFQEQAANPSKRGFQAVFQWSIFAELPIN